MSNSVYCCGDEDDDDIFFIVFLYAAVMWYNSLRQRSRLTRSAIIQSDCSPWKRLFMFGDEGSFLEMTGFNRDAFIRLKSYLFAVDHDVRRVGRPSSLDSDGELGLYLLYVGSQMKTKYLCQLA